MLSNLNHISNNNRPYTHSRRWRMKFNHGRFTTPLLYRRTGGDNTKLQGFYWQNRSNYLYDEYPVDMNLGPGVGVKVYSRYSAFNTPPPDNAYDGPYPFREIPARVVTHDIGNGENDFQLDKIILDAQYDTKTYLQYSYAGRPTVYGAHPADPKLVFESRNTTYADEVPTATIDLVQRNYQALQWVNPWRSRMNTPGGTSGSPSEFHAGDIITRESLVFVTPFLKYRRGRIYLETEQKMTTIRSVQVLATEFGRKTYG